MNKYRYFLPLIIAMGVANCAYAQVIEMARASYCDPNYQPNGTRVDILYGYSKPLITETNDVYIYTTGYRYSDFDLDNNVVQTTPNYRGLGDIVLAKYNAQGDLYWRKSAGGSKAEQAIPLYNQNGQLINKNALYDKGYLYVTGYFQGVVDLDFTNAKQYFVGDSINDMTTSFVAKYDTIGNLIWAKTIKNPYADTAYSSFNNTSIGLVRILPDSSLLIYCTARYFNDTTTHRFDNVNFERYMMLKIHTQTGSIKQIIDKKSSVANQRNVFIQTIDDSGNIYAIASVVDSINISLNPSTPQYIQTEQPARAVLVLSKYDANKQLLWYGQVPNLMNFPGTNNMNIRHINIDSNQNLYLTGVFRGKIDFKLGVDTMIRQSNSSDGFMAKYNAQGILQWVNTQPTLEDIGSPVFLSDNTIILWGTQNSTDTTATNLGASINRISAIGNTLKRHIIEHLTLADLSNLGNDRLLLTGYLPLITNGMDVDMDVDINSDYLLNGGALGCDALVWATYRIWNVSTHETPENNTNIFPNPAHTSVQITTDAPAHISIYDITGKQVRTAHTATPTTDIDVNNLPSGIYTVKIVANKTTQAQKLVIVR